MADLVRRFGAREGRTLWLAARGACDHIRDNVRRFDIACDLVEADCLYLGAGPLGQHTVRVEHGTRQGLDLDSRIYEGEALATVLGTRRYRAGVRYGGTFAIDAHAYAQGMKRALVAAGVRVFEDSPVVTLGGERVETAHGSVLADRVIVCLDRYAPDWAWPATPGTRRRSCSPARRWTRPRSDRCSPTARCSPGTPTSSTSTSA